MRVLLSAYACEPGKGSEPEVGLRMVLAAAERHSVWVLTRENNVGLLTEYLRDHPRGPEITVIGFDLSPGHLKLKKLAGHLGTVWYYDRWQKAIEEVAARLDREHDFDLVHHVTLAAYWTRLGVARLRKPLVVGPVGGAATSPLQLLPILGPRGMVGEWVRLTVRPLVARATGARRAQRNATAVVAQNEEALRAIGVPERTIILPNGLIGATSEDLAPRMPSSQTRFIYAGRLVGWKAPVLAIRALANYPSESATLEIYGSGPLGRRLEREAKRLGLTDRINFHGAVARSTFLRTLSASTALIHPALHEDAGLVVAEALSTGTPVVCLDRAGPPVIASYWPPALSRAVSPSSPRRTARALADALTQVAGVSAVPDGSPASRFTDEILAIYERAVTESRLSAD